MTLTLMYATDFYDQLEHRIIPALRSDFVVLADRYFYTLLARAAARGIERDYLNGLYEMAVRPDLTFWLNVRPEVAFEREFRKTQTISYWESGRDLSLSDDLYQSFIMYQAKIKKEFDDAGITIFTYYVNIGDTETDAEIDATYTAAKLLGAQGAVGSYGQAVARRLAPFAAKHGIFAGLHNHDNLSDPDAFNTEASFEKGLSYSPNLKATLDVRHFTAANGDCLGFLERHHERVSSVHLGDRRRNNGRSTPFGEGDAPIIEILRLIHDNHWPIVALLEFEHGTLRKEVDEVRLMFDYCKRALA